MKHTLYSLQAHLLACIDVSTASVYLLFSWRCYAFLFIVCVWRTKLSRSLSGIHTPFARCTGYTHLPGWQSEQMAWCRMFYQSTYYCVVRSEHCCWTDWMNVSKLTNLTLFIYIILFFSYWLLALSLLLFLLLLLLFLISLFPLHDSCFELSRLHS